MSKKVLIHSLIFSPDGVSTAYLYNDIALRFQKEGYEVVVLSTTPHFNVAYSGKVPAGHFFTSVLLITNSALVISIF